MDANDNTRELSPAPADGAAQAALEPEGTWLRQNAGAVFWVSCLLVGAAVLWGIPSVVKFGIVMLGLGLVIFIHELGHFATAKWCDVYVETFSIGFGPALPGCRWQRGETTYMIALFPLGGYVKMLGEGAENDEDEDNPRSFKNKPVWQRMVIISAGVINNVILGCLCFIFVFMTRGDEQAVGAVGKVDAGSPAWKTGLKSGDLIMQIGNIKHPSFNDLMATVPLTNDPEIPIVFGIPNRTRQEAVIRPRRNPDDKHPVIGVTPPSSLKFLPLQQKGDRLHPVQIGSAADRAQPAFENGDRIVAATDPDRLGVISELPPDPRDLKGDQRQDYFAYWVRQAQLAGQPMIVRVRRGSGTVDIRVPPAFHYTLGLRMQIGRVAAVLPAVTQIHARDPNVEGSGDKIKAVEVEDVGGVKLRWSLEPSPTNARSVASLVGLGGTPLALGAAPLIVQGGAAEKPLDPLRLPFELQQWAKRQQTKRKVIVTVERAVGNRENTPVPVELTWNDSYDFDDVVPLGKGSPLAITGLGIAYYVDTSIAAIEPDSPGARARSDKGDALQKGDLITGVRFFRLKLDNSDQTPLQAIVGRGLWSYWKRGSGEEPGDKAPLKENQWAHVESILQDKAEVKKLIVTVDRGKDSFDILLEAREDPTWPKVDRGMYLITEMQMQKAERVGEALSMGLQKTIDFIRMVYQMLQGLVTGRIALDTVGGPIMIFAVGMDRVDYNPFTFIVFLGMISVNLAVINFLPIPVLDGGHFVFLVYEGLRGKPASEKIRIGATYIGLGLILLLMVFVIFMDVKRLWG